MTEVWVFSIAATIALFAGVAMVLARNSVHAALFLVATQVSLAVLFLLQGAFFIAALQVIVYAGAIMVLFVFVIMLLGVDQKEALVEPLEHQRPIAIGLGVVLLAEGIYLAANDFLSTLAPSTVAVPLEGEGNVEAIARVLFTRWAFPFEVTSVLLVVAVAGVMVLAQKRTTK